MNCTRRAGAQRIFSREESLSQRILRWGRRIRTLGSYKESGGALRPLHQVAGADPEPLESAKRDTGSLRIFGAQGSPRQRLELALMQNGSRSVIAV
jgi:hypothetical protein